MRSAPRRLRRRGAVTTEAALVLPVFLIIVLGMLDLGVGVFRFNTISHASRYGVRQAMVHGEHAPAGWNGGRWRPGTGPDPDVIEVPATTSAPPIDAVRPQLVNCPLDGTIVRYEWLDDNDRVGSRVQCRIKTSWTPFMTIIFGGSTWYMTATSTMPIAH